jgi:hypothetical protein
MRASRFSESIRPPDQRGAGRLSRNRRDGLQRKELAFVKDQAIAKDHHLSIGRFGKRTAPVAIGRTAIQ